MNKEELKQKIRTDLSLANADLPDITAEIVVKRVDEYIESLKPGKEVIPRAWGKEVDKALRNLDRGFDYLDVLGSAFSDFGLSAPASQTKFIRALVNGYEVEPEPKYIVLEPIEWVGDDDDRAYAFKTQGGIRWDTIERSSDDQFFTTDEIEKYHLGDFEREEVDEDE